MILSRWPFFSFNVHKYGNEGTTRFRCLSSHLLVDKLKKQFWLIHFTRGFIKDLFSNSSFGIAFMGTWPDTWGPGKTGRMVSGTKDRRARGRRPWGRRP